MYHIRANAEVSVRNLLKDVVKRAGTNVLEAIDYLDDGSPVRCISIVDFLHFDANIYHADSTTRGDQRRRRICDL